MGAINPPVGPPPAVALVIAECNTPPVNSGSSDVALPWDTFYDQTGTKIGTGAPTDAAVLAALAVLGLSVNSAGTIFTVTQSGVYAIRFDLTPQGANAHESIVRLLAGSASGYSYFSPPAVIVPVAASTNTVGLAHTEAWLSGNSFQITEIGTNSEQDVSYVAMALVRVR